MMKEPDLILNMKEAAAAAANKEGVQQQQQHQHQQQNSNKKAVLTASDSTRKSHQSSSSNHSTSTPLSPLSPSTVNETTSMPTSPTSTKKKSSNNNTNEAKTNSPCKKPSKTHEKTTSSCVSSPTLSPTSVDDVIAKFNLSDKISVLKCNNQIKELHTVLRDKETSHSDFKFYSDRLIRLLVEESLNELPYSSEKVTTPANCEYDGIKYIKGVCGVSIMRSGEAMEKGLRECCRSIRIGKILIQSSDEDHKKSSVVYAKFPSDIISRKILLMYPITTSGSTVNLAIRTLKEHGVAENNILVLCLFSTPHGLQSVSSLYPDVHILTSEIYPSVPTDFGQRYFGTE